MKKITLITITILLSVFSTSFGDDTGFRGGAGGDRSVYFDLLVSEAVRDFNSHGDTSTPWVSYPSNLRSRQFLYDSIVIDNEPQGRALREWRRELLNPW